MKRRKNGAVGSRRLKVGKQIRIPVTGDLAQRQLGAAAFLAILAYPADIEWVKRKGVIKAVKTWAKRKNFIKAVKAGLLKEAMRPGYPRKQIPKVYREFREKRIEQVLTGAFRRILRWRIPAGMAANWMLMDGAPFGTGILPGNIVGRPIILRRAMEEIRKNVEEQDGTHREEDSALVNLHHRVWANSLPVLHLVTPMAEFLNSKDDLIDLIYDPSWVRVALLYAAVFREYLPRKIPSFTRRKAVRLLPQ